MKLNKISKILIALCIISIFTLSFAKKVFGNSNNNAKSSYKTVVVYSGDTLWSIALENKGNYNDIRKLIYDIRKVNSLKSPVIMPGQTLRIPTN